VLEQRTYFVTPFSARPRLTALTWLLIVNAAVFLAQVLLRPYVFSSTGIELERVLGLVPAWNPPDELDEWPVLGVDLDSTGFSGMARPTNHAAFAGLLAGVKEVPPGGSDSAVLQFYALDDATQVLGDVPMFQAQHVRAWLATAFGNLLMSIALSPQADHEQLVAEGRRRLLIPRRLQAAPKWGVQFEEGELGLLYNCRQSPQGTLDWSGMRVGRDRARSG